MWGTRLLTFGLVFSKMSVIPHTAYVASLAPALAALSGAGIVMFWRAYHATGPRGWLLPAATAAELAWAAFLWRSYTGFLPWALYSAIAIGAAGLAVMTAARRHQPLPATTLTRFVRAGLVLAVFAAVFAAPATWAASVLDTKYDGSRFNASAGPAGGGGSFGAGAASNFGPGGLLASTDSLTSAERDLYNYVNTHRDGASYLMAVNSWTEPPPTPGQPAKEVMTMGRLQRHRALPHPPPPAAARKQRTAQVLPARRLSRQRHHGGRRGVGGKLGAPRCPPRTTRGRRRTGAETLYECQA